jgi:anti-sigma regulatory factor (Ser/Thr protein kinase)
LEKRPLGGLGVFMMKQSVDELTHRALPEGGNELTFRKRV